MRKLLLFLLLTTGLNAQISYDRYTHTLTVSETQYFAIEGSTLRQDLEPTIRSGITHFGSLNEQNVYYNEWLFHERGGRRNISTDWTYSTGFSNNANSYTGIFDVNPTLYHMYNNTNGNRIIIAPHRVYVQIPSTGSSSFIDAGLRSVDHAITHIHEIENPISYGSWRPTIQDKFNSLNIGGVTSRSNQINWIDFEQTRNGYRGNELISTDTRIITVRVIESNVIESREGYSANAINEDVNQDGDMFDVISYTSNNYEGLDPENGWILGGQLGRNNIMVTENLTRIGNFFSQAAYYSNNSPEMTRARFAEFWKSNESRRYIGTSVNLWLMGNGQSAGIIYKYNSSVRGYDVASNEFNRPNIDSFYIRIDNNQARAEVSFYPHITRSSSIGRNTTLLERHFGFSRHRYRGNTTWYLYRYEGEYYNVQTRVMYENEIGEDVNNDTDMIDQVEQLYIYEEELEQEFVVRDWIVIHNRD